MYQFSYDDVMSEDEASARLSEKMLFDRSIELLEIAREKGPHSFEAIDAIYYTSKLWTILIEDLGSPENALAKELRANLISVGLFIIKELEKIRQGVSGDFESIIEINKTIRNGL